MLFAARERRDPPDPGEPAERARELPRQQHLHDDVAALAAVLLGDPDPVVAGRGQLLPQVERVLVLAPLGLAGPVLRALPVDPGAGLAAKQLELLGQLEVQLLRHGRHVPLAAAADPAGSASRDRL